MAESKQKPKRRLWARPAGIPLDDLAPGVRYVLKLHRPDGKDYAIAGVLVGVQWRRGLIPNIVLKMLGGRAKIKLMTEVEAIHLAPNPANDEPLPPDAGMEFCDS